MTDLATANATEEEKLKVMMSQSSEGFDPAKCVLMYLNIVDHAGCTGIPPSLLVVTSKA